MNCLLTVQLLFLSLFIFGGDALAQKDLRENILDLVNSVDGKMGVGIKNVESGDTLSIHGGDHFPMQSVYKFHLALAVLDQVDKGNLSTDQKIMVKQSEYFPDTWSPIAKKYPEGDVELTIRELLQYTVSQSDNVGCDILFRLAGGPAKVNEYIHRQGIGDVAIVNTEAEMHTAWDMQFNNWTTPTATAHLLGLFTQRKILTPVTHNFLMETMEQTITGNKRIKGLLPVGTPVAHKTGMGGNDAGLISAINDVGIITLPNGSHIAIALFISNTKESVEKLEGVMAKISKLVYDHYSK
ncbi:class A beta-lactamase, subclass A2 [Chryseolinea sp. H1M3-3]|uniref:class A beta-lactamase, subclass A2 n=1 Tax=Chryseolinea sp. H1M3-3 TaxID=3034144 RepID=UPI0023ED74D1|nr:class A beta-lactamase, subclass A2 [Chryseolinea sp. H1M3-3]